MGHYDEDRELSRLFDSHDYRSGVVEGRSQAQQDHFAVMMAIRDGLQKKADIVINADGDVTIHHVSKYFFKRDAKQKPVPKTQQELAAELTDKKLTMTMPPGFHPIGAVNEVRQNAPAMKPALDELEEDGDEAAISAGVPASSPVE